MWVLGRHCLASVNQGAVEISFFGVVIKASGWARRTSFTCHRLRHFLILGRIPRSLFEIQIACPALRASAPRSPHPPPRPWPRKMLDRRVWEIAAGRCGLCQWQVKGTSLAFFQKTQTGGQHLASPPNRIPAHAGFRLHRATPARHRLPKNRHAGRTDTLEL